MQQCLMNQAMLDEPKGTEQTSNYATGGWVAAPIVSRLVSRIASLLGILPRSTETPSNELRAVKPRTASLSLKPISGGGHHSAAF